MAQRQMVREIAMKILLLLIGGAVLAALIIRGVYAVYHDTKKGKNDE